MFVDEGTIDEVVGKEDGDEDQDTSSKEDDRSKQESNCVEESGEESRLLVYLTCKGLTSQLIEGSTCSFQTILRSLTSFISFSLITS